MPGGWVWLAGSTFRAGSQMGQALTRGINERAQRWDANRGARTARHGMVGPGDADPPPGYDFYDYRGVCLPRHVKPLRDGPFRLGYVIDPRRGPAFPIGLQLGDLATHAAILGPTGGGKTSGVVVPWICAAVRAGASVVAVDVRGDLMQKVIEYGRATGPLNGRVAAWDFTNTGQSVVWDWLGELTTDTEISAAVEALVGRENPNDPQPFFAQRDRRLLAGLIASVLSVQRPPRAATLLQAVRDQSLVVRLAAQSPIAATKLAELLALAPDEFAKVMSGVVNALSVFDHSGVAAVTTPTRRTAPFRIVDLEATPSLLVINSPLHGARIAAASSALFLSQIMQHLYRRFSHGGRPVIIMVDEAARLLDRINLEEVSSIGRGAGAALVLALQSAGQIRDETVRHTILDNCSTIVCLAGPATDSAKYLSQRLGQRQQSTLSFNQGLDASGRATRQYSRNSGLTAVLGEREITGPPFGPFAATVHNPNLIAAPIMVDLYRPDLQSAPAAQP